MIRYEPNPDLFEAVEQALDESAGTGTGEARAVIGAALTFAYRQLRKHADGYRDTDLYRLHQERRYENPVIEHRATFDRGFARGIEAAARDMALLLGVDESEISTLEADRG